MNLLTSVSSLDMMWSLESTRWTSEPMALNRLANSQPITPAPRISTLFGELARLTASSLVSTRVPSTVRLGRVLGRVPVAMTMWSPENLLSAQKIEGHSSFVFDIEFFPDNSGFYSVSNDKTIRFNDYAKSSVIKNLPSKIKSIDLNENGDLMAGASLNGEVYLINTQNFEERLLYLDSGNIIHSVKFSPDGSTLVIGNESGNVILLEADNGNPIIELVGPMARINDIEFSKDGKLLAVASWDGNVYLWLMEDLNQLPLVFKDNNSHIWDISFSSDGNYLVTGSTKDIIKIWPTNPKLLADKFCENFSRNMDLKEWDRYVGNDIELMKTCEDFSLSER